MAVSYGSRTVLANVSRLHSVANTQARTFGEINNSGGGHAINIHLVAPINASATGGTYDLYLVESQDGSEWTDGIDPTTDTGDVAGKIADAKFLASFDTTYDGTDRTQIEWHGTVSGISRAQYIGFVLVNNSDQTTPASGADGDSVIYTVS